MDNSQHTRGPWSVHKDANGLLIRGNGTRLVTAYIASEADARLIAAAPNLLWALTELSAMYARTWDRVDGALVMMPDAIARFEAAHAAAQAVIAAATGSAHE